MMGGGGAGKGEGVELYTFCLRRFDSETQPQGLAIKPDRPDMEREAQGDNIELRAHHLGAHDVPQY